MKKLLRIPVLAFTLAASLVASQSALASGVTLATSVVIVEEGDGEGAMEVKNNENSPMLVYSAVENVPEDPADMVMISPPVARVDPGESQVIRFLLKPGHTFKTERMMRAIFEGIPQSADGNVVAVSIRHNIPLIIRPKGLAPTTKMWIGLTWHQQADGSLHMRNDGRYVVRMSPSVTLLPSETVASMPRNYILPGETLLLTIDANKTTAMTGDTEVRFLPASVYGYIDTDNPAMGKLQLTTP